MTLFDRPRQAFLPPLLGVVALLGYGYYLQYGEGLQPCNLCIFQRVAFFTVGVIALAGVLLGSRGWLGRALMGLMSLAALVGAGIAGRQLWLQSLPEDQVPECGPGLDFMLQAFPLQEVIQTVLRGSGDCAKVVWTFLGLSIPGWALVAFGAIALYGLLGLLRRRS